MENVQLDNAIEEYIDKALSKRKTCLEATKQLASEVWKLICNNKNASNFKKVEIIQFFNGDINIKSDKGELNYFFSGYSKDKEFLDLIYIIFYTLSNTFSLSSIASITSNIPAFL